MNRSRRAAKQRNSIISLAIKFIRVFSRLIVRTSIILASYECFVSHTFTEEQNGNVVRFADVSHKSWEIVPGISELMDLFAPTHFMVRGIRILRLLNAARLDSIFCKQMVTEECFNAGRPNYLMMDREHFRPSRLKKNYKVDVTFRASTSSAHPFHVGPAR